MLISFLRFLSLKNRGIEIVDAHLDVPDIMFLIDLHLLQSMVTPYLFSVIVAQVAGILGFQSGHRIVFLLDEFRFFVIFEMILPRL